MGWTSLIMDFFDFALPILDNVPLVRTILGFVLVFFLPGFAWTLVLFKKVNHLERVVLSFGLSIALVTLSILFTNIVLKISITGVNSLLTTLVITALPLIIYFVNKWIRKKTVVKKPDGSDITE